MKILMVCLGNICRSPLAHGILAHLVAESGLDWQVDSAGTGDWHVGKEPDRRSIAVAHKYGVDISAQRARLFVSDFFDLYDYIYVMDRNNYRDVLAKARNAADKDKVRMFLPDGIVPDPYFDENQFEPVFHMIEQRCRELIRDLAK
ncbi:protein-tyrosine phosphatase [Sphingobacterium allocomposti]|jgi:protein-tyrosine phosphatase|uniref:protein-tyrosine-phosphatase n=1 Tax=Sphingobacterium allocomposti TaxID=415956 RepID=A0A5S5DJ72_9SPHI|nr:low molecular weight protein-tyrosine-phosphatase [Sphingobacterium composti Yoo et al. 2007 non Ten et al. 2007]TYP95957.1 protein-tyrosine phosphatase [Sphingobacterium composti Yoo et al. 2007 non Ten et al. 2007]HLS95335.1 low molecular weight protein-tyrosine-phosphatase [Sphingobacterium sp.]